MPVKHIQNLSELATIITNEQRAIIIKFSASWCAPCKSIAPIYKQYSDNPRCSQSIVFIEVDIDEAPKIAEKFGISGMPTFKAIKKSKVIDDFSGASKERLVQMISTCM